MAATSEATITVLQSVPAFSTLGDEELANVAQVTVRRQFEAGAVVFRAGDASDTCYAIRSGRARAIREHPDGRSITLATFGPGDIFGELAMFDDERRSATVETLEPTELIGILGGDMRRLMREHPDVAVKLIAGLGRRLRRRTSGWRVSRSRRFRAGWPRCWRRWSPRHGRKASRPAMSS